MPAGPQAKHRGLMRLDAIGAGEFSGSSNAARCEACAAGSVPTAPTASACRGCEAGEGPVPIGTACQPCVAGTFSAAQSGDAHACVPCAGETFSNHSRATQCFGCTQCSAGFVPTACTATADRTCRGKPLPTHRCGSQPANLTF